MTRGEVISQTKFFIDSPSQGNKQLVRVKSADVTDDQDVEVVKAVGVEGGAGFRHQTGGGTISLDVYRETVAPEVAWRTLQRTRETFTFTIQDTDGLRESYQSCRVANVARKSDESGSHMDTVKLVFLRRTDR